MKVSLQDNCPWGADEAQNKFSNELGILMNLRLQRVYGNLEKYTMVIFITFAYST